MKHKIILLSILGLLTAVLSSCLKTGVTPLANSNANIISSIGFEYWWTYSPSGTSTQALAIQTLTVSSVIRNDSVIVNSITVPNASTNNNPGSFSATIRANVTLANIVGRVNISPAASIAPVNAPTLGVIQDFSAGSYKYKVTAANGDTRTYTLVIKQFLKP